MRRPRATAVRLAALLALLWAVCAASACASLGARPDGERLARARRSPQWHGDAFADPQPIWNDLGGALRGALFGKTAPAIRPAGPLPIVHDAARLAQPPASGLRVTWFGHSSALVEIDGVRVLVDPIWSERASPFGWIGPRRWFAPPLPLDALPPLDAVVISHDHYDHLDQRTIEALRSTGARFVVPLGVGAHLVRWGVAESRIVELDWWERTSVGALTIVATPARHVSGRLSPRSNRTLWASYALVGPQHRAWFSGDTGFHADLERIGERLGPFDLTLIEAGQYDAHWPDQHLGPEQAVEAHLRVRGRALLPVHWALFRLAQHGWTEPIERVQVAARCQGVTVLTPRPGESLEPTTGATGMAWWPRLPWRPARERPVVATKRGNPAERIELPGCRRDPRGEETRASTVSP